MIDLFMSKVPVNVKQLDEDNKQSSTKNNDASKIEIVPQKVILKDNKVDHDSDKSGQFVNQI